MLAIFLSSFFILFSFVNSYAVSLNEIKEEFSTQKPTKWSETLSGVKRKIVTDEKKIVLTLDACGGKHGSGYDSKLVNFLIKEKIPATLFFSGSWIDKNKDVVKMISKYDFLEIANHGLTHRPASVNGRRAYNIRGTKNIDELYQEVEGNNEKIRSLTGKVPKYFRSGTAYYDEVSTQIINKLGLEVIGYSLLGDAGAKFNKKQVVSQLLKYKNGDIVLLHMNHPNGDTAEGVIEAIPLLQKRGVRFVKLSDYMLGD